MIALPPHRLRLQHSLQGLRLTLRAQLDHGRTPAFAFARLHGRRVVFRIASDADCEPDRLLIEHARDRWLYAWGLERADVQRPANAAAA